MTMTTGHRPRPTGDVTRMAYADLATPQEMRDDCRAAGAALALVPAPRHDRVVPRLQLEDLPVDAAHRLADALALEQD